MPPSPSTGRKSILPLLATAIPAAVLWLAAAALALDPDAERSRQHSVWLEEVEPLLTAEERSAWEALQRPYQRDAFIDRFWKARAEFHPTWKNRVLLARQQFGSVVGERAQTVLLIGPPEFILTDLCPETFRPMEAWFYPAIDPYWEGFYLVFVHSPPGPEAGYRRWSPDQGLATIGVEPDRTEIAVEQCIRRGEWEMVVERAVDWQELASHHEIFPPPPAAWVESFLDQTIRIDRDSPLLTAALGLAFPGTVADRTVVQAELEMPIAAITPSTDQEQAYRLQIDGEILRRGALLDRFRYRFDRPVSEVVEGTVSLAFHRYLLPGEYDLILELEDLVSGGVFRSEAPLRVPATAEHSGAAATSLAEANAVLAATDHAIKIRPLDDELHTGRLRIEADAEGNEIAKVTFVLDGRPVMSKTRPPYSVEIDLGRAPRLHSLVAVAYGVDGAELARDRVPINGGPHRFSVRLIEPHEGRRYIQSLRAVAEVHLPAEEHLDRIEFFLNETRVATLFQPPFAQPMHLPQRERITYVRAVAYLEDGNQTEDLVFVNAPESLAELRINLVELYTTVSDRKGHPVDGLTGQDFVVREEDEVQQIRRFERVTDRSIHAGVILDASTSMEEEIRVSIDGALEFFASVIRPEDRAAVFVFNDEPRLLVPFTNDLERLEQGLEGVDAEGETALYDTLVYSLFYFAGLRGKRALILISDGADSNSRHTLNEAMDFAKRSGVSIYPIALGLDRRGLEARRVLMGLARETGGRYFSIGSASELDDIYAAIDRELRSQYLLVYQSTHEEGGAFREVAVEVTQPGLEARTIPGYYP